MTDITKVQSTKSKHKKFDFSRYKQRHIALKIYYFGWDYDGLAEQVNSKNTVEHFIIEALIKTCLIESRQKSKFNRCGRTDKGVSSYGQVIDLNVRSNLYDESLSEGLFTPEGYAGDSFQAQNTRIELDYIGMINGLLPDHIRVVAWAPVKLEFSSRYSCQSRSYSYIFPRGDLCLSSMNEAAEYLVGTHNFRNLCSFDLKNGVINHERTIHNVSIEPIKTCLAGSNENCDIKKSTIEHSELYSQYCFYEFTIVGRGFLYHQIRCIMTILFLVGRKKEEPEVVRDLLDINKCPARPRYSPASPLPLSLFDCKYSRDDLSGWNHSQVTLVNIYKQLKQVWLRYKTKAVMIERVLFDMESKVDSETAGNESDFTEQTGNWKDFGLEHDNMSDTKYIKLMKRSREDSLEQKMEMMQAKQKRLL